MFRPLVWRDFFDRLWCIFKMIVKLEKTTVMLWYVGMSDLMKQLKSSFWLRVLAMYFERSQIIMLLSTVKIPALINCTIVLLIRFVIGNSFFFSFIFLLTDAISENQPRVIDDSRARKLANDLKRCAYYETCATYGLNVERVFQDGRLILLFEFVYLLRRYLY